jgi:DNA-binding PadR family transcriptional regulator
MREILEIPLNREETSICNSRSYLEANLAQLCGPRKVAGETQTVTLEKPWHSPQFFIKLAGQPANDVTVTIAINGFWAEGCFPTSPAITRVRYPHPPWRLTSPFYWFYIVEEMKQGELLGSLEHIVLLALVRLDDNAHGMIVRREIEERTGRNVSIGAVYATLERLEAKGYVSSFTGEPTPERGGRAKRLFRVEAAGKRALQISNQTIRSMTVGLKGHWGTI